MRISNLLSTNVCYFKKKCDRNFQLKLDFKNSVPISKNRTKRDWLIRLIVDALLQSQNCLVLLWPWTGSSSKAFGDYRWIFVELTLLFLLGCLQSLLEVDQVVEILRLRARSRASELGDGLVRLLVLGVRIEPLQLDVTGSDCNH